MIDTQSLSRDQCTVLLARLAYELTVSARNTYEVGTDKVLQPELLRAYNELLHRVTAAAAQHHCKEEGFSVETIMEMVRSFGERHNCLGEIDWVLNRACQKVPNMTR